MTATAVSAIAGAVANTARSARVTRVPLASARDDRLFFAQVREDPRIEIAALQPAAGERIVVVSSGGCTALSLLGAGAGTVHAVDTNRTQNHLVELKAVAVRELGRSEAIAFLGGSDMSLFARHSLYALLRAHLSDGARAYWDGHPMAVNGGVISAGVSERFIKLVAWVIRHIVHSRELVDRMLFCRTLDEQRSIFASEWNTRSWRGLFTVLLNRWSMSRAYDPRFFARIGRANFAEHFLELANHSLTEVPIADNYFIHQMLTGRYPVELPEGVPPYLGERGFAVASRRMSCLTLVDGGVTEHLRTLSDHSVHGFALSNICEWLSEEQIAELFREVERVAAPGARVVFRNFVGWTDLPSTSPRLCEDHELGTQLIRLDRSVVQPRVVVCRVCSDR